MDGIQIGPCLYEHPQGLFSIFSAAPGDLIVKQCRCQSFSQADGLLKEAMAQAQLPIPEYVGLRGVRLASCQNSSDFTFNFIYQKLTPEVPIEFLSNSDLKRFEAADLSEYRKVKPIATEQGTINIVISENQSVRLKRDVIIRTYKPLLRAEDANPILSEAFVQILVQNPNNCQFLDIAMCGYTGRRNGFKLKLVMEKYCKDIDTDMKKASTYSLVYPEANLPSFMKQIIAGLLHAKSKVTYMQSIAHKNLSLAHIYRVDDKYKVGVYGASAHFNTTTSCDMQIAYLGPEKRISGCFTGDPFPADVFSLGIMVLHLFKQTLPMNLRATDRTQLSVDLSAEVESLSIEAEKKTLLTRMLSMSPEERPTLEEINTEVDSWIKKLQQTDPKRMSPEQLEMTEHQLKWRIFELEHPRNPNNDDVLAELYHQLSELFVRMHKLSEAEQFIEKARAIYEKKHGLESIAIASIFATQALIYLKTENFQRALEQISTSLRIRQHHALGSHPETAASYSLLAELFEQGGELDLAELTGLRSLCINQHFFGDDNPETFRMYLLLAYLYQTMDAIPTKKDFEMKMRKIDWEVRNDRSSQINHIIRVKDTYSSVVAIYEVVSKMKELENNVLPPVTREERARGTILPGVTRTIEVSPEIKNMVTNAGYTQIRTGSMCCALL